MIYYKIAIFLSKYRNGCIEFFGDMEWTMEAFINLMKNCMEHSQPDGIVHCDYSDNPLYAEIRIWMMEQVLIRRTYHIFLIAFIVAGVQ